MDPGLNLQNKSIYIYRFNSASSPAYTKIFTVYGSESQTISIYLGWHYPSDSRFTSCCDAISEDGFSGGVPVLDVLGMLKGNSGNGRSSVHSLQRSGPGTELYLKRLDIFKEWGYQLG